MINTVQIYMQLLGEGTTVYRPTMAEVVEDGIYRVLSTENYDPDDEEWAFPPGTLVKCEREMHEGDLILVARGYVRE